MLAAWSKETGCRGPPPPNDPTLPRHPKAPQVSTCRANSAGVRWWHDACRKRRDAVVGERAVECRQFLLEQIVVFGFGCVEILLDHVEKLERGVRGSVA